MPIISLPTGLQLNYQFWRGGQQVQDLDPSKRTVIFLHAYGANSSTWNFQMTDQRINQLYNFVTFDAKYHGKSTGPLTPGYTYQHYANELAMAMDRLHLSNCHFIAESFAGCRPAMKLAITRPDLVASMMLISPGFFDGEPDDVVEVMQELSDAYVAGAKRYQAGQVRHSERAVTDEALQGYINYMFGQCLTSEEDVQAEMTAFDNEMGKTRPEYTAEVAACHMMCERIPDLDKIKQPVLLLRGSRNTAESPESACDLWKEALSNSSRLEFHLCHGAPNRAVKTFPFIVNRFIAGWLAKNSVKK